MRGNLSAVWRNAEGIRSDENLVRTRDANDLPKPYNGTNAKQLTRSTPRALSQRSAFRTPQSSLLTPHSSSPRRPERIWLQQRPVWHSPDDLPHSLQIPFISQSRDSQHAESFSRNVAQNGGA